MAGSSTTAALLLLLLLSLLAAAHCRPLEENLTEVVESGDENGPPNTTPPAVLPAEQEQQQHGFLRLPSHRLRRHRPCHHGLFHRHLWWARHHGAFGDSPRRIHRHVEARLSDLPVLPAGETREVNPMPEPDPDRSLLERDGDVEVASSEPSFGDADGAHEEAAREHEGAAVRAWRREMQRRWFHHHGMRLHRHRHGNEQEEEAGEGLKRFHPHHRDEEDEAGKDTMSRERFRHAEHDEDIDSDDEAEEMVRRFRKEIMRSRFGHGRRFHRHHHHYGHRHAEEDAEKADAQEEGGVVSWIKGLMNRF